MKRMFALSMLGILLISFAALALAESNDSNSSDDSRDLNDSSDRLDDSNLSEDIRNNTLERENLRESEKQLRENLREERKQMREDFVQNIKERNELRKDIRELIREKGFFTYIDENGTAINFTKVDGQLRLRDKEHFVKSNLNITIDVDENNQTILTIIDKNQTRTIKIMPDTAAAIALERLRLKNCNETNNCIIELKDVPLRKLKKAIYEMQVERHYKILGLFSAKAEDKAQVDADTGEVRTTKGPWWSFMASRSD